MILSASLIAHDDTLLSDADINALCLHYGEALRPYAERIKAKDEGGRVYRHWGRIPDCWREYPLVWMANTGATAYHGDYHKYFSAGNARIRVGEIARLAIKDAIGNSPINKRTPRTQPTPVPLYFEGRYIKDRVNFFTEVDIVACYGQLLSRLPGPNLRYRAEEFRFSYDPSIRWDQELISNKHVGRAIAGMFWNRSQPVFNYGKLRYFPNTKRYAPQILSWMHDILHSIARVAIEDGQCVRWHTDGGIFRSDTAEVFIEYLWKQWGILASIKRQGWGRIGGINDVLIMEDIPRPNMQNRAQETEDNIRRDLDIGFLRSTFTGEYWEKPQPERDKGDERRTTVVPSLWEVHP